MNTSCNAFVWFDQLSKLTKISEEFDCAVLVTNQVPFASKQDCSQKTFKFLVLQVSSDPGSQAMFVQGCIFCDTP